ncbi:MAG: ribonuclease HII [Deltaproteobacteria bacterium]|nr:MAG: ribonuclease HII [Deltaproteobacteria bacterium]
MATDPLQTLLFDAPTGAVEQACAGAGLAAVIGVDEAGRGPLAGPVTVAAVLLPLPPPELPEGITDSKLLSEPRRERLAPILREALAHVVLHAEAEEIDRLNIRGATLAAMARAVQSLHAVVACSDALVLVDGRDTLALPRIAQRALVQGDRRSLAIACASVIAKTTRDARMREAEEQYPGYGFARHKGYGTAEHREALARLGPTPLHRRSFRWGTGGDGV